ncbi:hypothetical protein [Nodosilinea nodulosa]|uniref:hypothetical protein n=1 Tax=Nodosilinea nodulosa TaxID=416001 RepID=UPI0002F5A96E|nr:hypothetical protein [Nodosilinea nodulosa]
MTLNLFDTVRLKEDIALDNEAKAPAGTLGSIVEVLHQGEAYLVECFGGWVKYDAEGNFEPSNREDPEAFVETLGVETVYPHQLQLVKPAEESVGVRAQLLMLIEEMPEVLLEEVKDFAEFIQQKQLRVTRASE